MSLSLGILSTYPPTACGLATFSSALVRSLQRPSTRRVGIVRVVDKADSAPLPDVIGQWVRGSRGGAVAAAAELDRYDIAIIQHEYGIYGGRDGQDVLQLIRALRVPAITVLHTVLEIPTEHQRAILNELIDRSAAVVVMTQTARRRLVDHYRLASAKIHVIPHGAADNRADSLRHDGPPRVLTWGLLGEGKGIEWAIEAMALLRDLQPAPLYSVVGRTHPKVLQEHGERYRQGLTTRAIRLGISQSVTFDARYLSDDELRRVVRCADVVLLPYDSPDQVTSGVLTEAIAAGKPVISTGFPHAKEILSTGAGLLVPQRDPAAIAAALRRVLTEPLLAKAMALEARRLAPALLWPAVAEQYRAVAKNAARFSPLRTHSTLPDAARASA